MGAIIETKGVWRNFNVGTETISALKNVNIQIEKGSITILKGRSGSGKTTLINILGIIDKPTLGDVIIDGKDVSKMSDEYKNNMRMNDFGYIFQSGALIPNMTVYENVELVLRLKNVPSNERKRRVMECIEMMGLYKKAKYYAEELSGGEFQRIGIARAIVGRPKIICADEPTSALDFNSGCLVMRVLKRLSRDEKCTVIITTHDPKLLPMADKVYNLMDGEIKDE